MPKILSCNVLEVRDTIPGNYNIARPPLMLCRCKVLPSFYSPLPSLWYCLHMMHHSRCIIVNPIQNFINRNDDFMTLKAYQLFCLHPYIQKPSQVLWKVRPTLSIEQLLFNPKYHYGDWSGGLSVQTDALYVGETKRRLNNQVKFAVRNRNMSGLPEQFRP